MLPRTTTADGEEERVKNNSAGDGVDGGNQRENTIWNITADDILRGNLIITTREHIPPPPPSQGIRIGFGITHVIKTVSTDLGRR